MARKEIYFWNLRGGHPKFAGGPGLAHMGSLGVFAKNFRQNFRNIGVDAGASGWDILARNWPVKGPQRQSGSGQMVR